LSIGGETITAEPTRRESTQGGVTFSAKPTVPLLDQEFFINAKECENRKNNNVSARARKTAVIVV